MSKAYLQGFYDYFVQQPNNPYETIDRQNYCDWHAGWIAGQVAFRFPNAKIFE